MPNEQNLVIPGQYDSIQQACQFVGDAAESAGLDSQSVFDVQLAVDEACANIVEHAYEGEGKGDICITCGTDDVREGTRFYVRLEDQGQPFDPDVVATPSLATDADELKIGGLGMLFMRKVMDQIEFSFRPGSNELVMFKRIEEETAPRVWHRPLEQSVFLVGARGRLDHTTVLDMETALNQLLSAGHVQLVVDLSQASYINSGGLRALVSAWRAARKQGGDLHLCGVHGRLREIIEMVGFERVFQIHSTPSEAANALIVPSDA